MDSQEIRRLLEQDEEALLHQLGRQLAEMEEKANFGPPSISDLVEDARKYCFDVNERVRDLVCSDPRVSVLLTAEQPLDNVQIAVAVAAVLSQLEWLPQAHALVLSAILVKRGLRSYCLRDN